MLIGQGPKDSGHRWEGPGATVTHSALALLSLWVRVLSGSQAQLSQWSPCIQVPREGP